MKFVYYTLSLLFIISCSSGHKKNVIEDNIDYEYAHGFKVAKYDDYIQISVNDPWNDSRILANYILVDKDKDIPKVLPQGVIIKIPVENVVVYNSPQCNVLDCLGAASTIKGVCEPEYITNEFIAKEVNEGRIQNLGMASSPDIEKILDLKPDVILAPGFQNNNNLGLSKTGIPVFQCLDYMERNPLGTSEWIKIYALLFNRIEIADSIFNSISLRYNNLKDLVSQVEFKPRLLTEKRYNNVWYLPGNNSFAATLYKDAGAQLAIADNELTGSLSLSTEEVLDKAGDADIWLIKYYGDEELSYNDLKNDYFLYSHFEAWKKQNIYICNTKEKSYYDMLPLHPDVILKDLIRVFHPEILDKKPELFEGMEHFFRKMSK